MSPGNPRRCVRLTPALHAIVAQAQGTGPEATAIRALLLLGAAHAGLDLSGVGREIAQAQIEPLHPAVITALRTVQDQDAYEGVRQVSDRCQTGVRQVSDTPGADGMEGTDGMSDPFSFGIDV